MSKPARKPNGTNNQKPARLANWPDADAAKARALMALGTLSTVKAACEAAKIGRTTFYDWMETDPAFASRVAEVREGALDELEAEAMKRAKEGSDVLLIFLLKSLRRVVYGDQRLTITLVSPEITQRLQQQVDVINSRESWTPSELRDALTPIWSTG